MSKEQSPAVIALDIGSKRIGVALAPFGTSLAIPLEPIVRTNLRNDLSAIVALLEAHDSATLVIGDPVTLAGSRGIASAGVDAFVAKLARLWAGEIRLVDERLTTAQSNKVLIGAAVSRARRRQLVDGMAATLILESYLGRSA
jgi:putative Holliday junction resolvase